jgi:hypothetical protein
MQLDDFLQTIKIENQNQDEASKAEATKVIHAMLFDYDENEVRVDFLGSSYRIQRSDIVDITLSDRAVVTPRQRGYGVLMTLKGSAVIRTINEYRASDFDQVRPFILNQPTSIPLTPLESIYTPKEMVWFQSRGLAHLTQATTRGDLTSTFCTIKTPTNSPSQCQTTCNVMGPGGVPVPVNDDNQNDDTYQDDQDADQIEDDSQFDGQLP